MCPLYMLVSLYVYKFDIKAIFKTNDQTNYLTIIVINRYSIIIMVIIMEI